MNTMVKFDWNDFTASNTGEYRLMNWNVLFLKGEFSDGHILAWFSLCPRGTCYDKIKGWVLLKPNNNKQSILGEVIDSFGTGQDNSDFMYKEKMNEWRLEHGRVSYFRNDDGLHKWNMSEE